MKKFSLILSLLVLTGLVACNEAEPSLLATSEEMSDEMYVSVEQASIQANLLREKIYGKGTRSNVQRVKNVECFYPNGKTRSGEDVMYYILNYGEEDGFAVVGANKEQSDVYALSDSGTLAMADTIRNPGLAAFFSMLPSTLGAIGGSGIDPVLPPKDTTTHDFVVIPEVIDLSSKLNPLLSYAVRQMHQNSPYNDKCFTSSGEPAAVGCSPLAVAMIMSFYETPKSYGTHTFNWELINGNWDTNAIKLSKLPELLSDLGLKHNLDVKYGKDNSGCSLEENYKRTFENFGYVKPRPFQTFTNADIYEFLSTKKTPCLMMGRGETSGHAWVCDGYYNDRYLTAFGSYSGKGLFLHMVFGAFLQNFSGQYSMLSGYFKFGETIVPAEKYNVDGDMKVWTQEDIKLVQYYNLKFVADITVK